MQIGDYLREMRRPPSSNNAVGLVTLSEKCGVHTSQIHRIEKNQNRPTVFSLVRICYGLGISPERFFDDTKVIPGASEWPRKQASPSLSQLQDKDVYSFIKKFRNGQERLAILAKLNQGMTIDTDTMPPSLSLETIQQTYCENATLSMLDFGVAINRARTGFRASLYNVDQRYKFDYESLGAIEDGKNTRIIFSDIVKLDQIFEMKGFFVALGWHTAQFNEGLLKISDEQKVTLVENWKEMSEEGTQALINSWRWIQSEKDEKTAADWLRDLRKEIFAPSK